QEEVLIPCVLDGIEKSGELFLEGRNNNKNAPTETGRRLGVFAGYGQKDDVYCDQHDHQGNQNHPFGKHGVR
ncbi:hypothetical protein, partial [Desulfosarcina sp.]|uniref:hypothetical protein n=1 Tax=Desulfosarcina sp. TaxID=2027861 RepID=UPI0035684A2D